MNGVEVEMQLIKPSPDANSERLADGLAQCPGGVDRKRQRRGRHGVGWDADDVGDARKVAARIDAFDIHPDRREAGNERRRVSAAVGKAEMQPVRRAPSWSPRRISDDRAGLQLAESSGGLVRQPFGNDSSGGAGRDAVAGRAGEWREAQLGMRRAQVHCARWRGPRS